MKMEPSKKPRIVGYYQKNVHINTTTAILLEYPDGIQKLTDGLMYSDPAEELVREWHAVPIIDLSALRDKIQSAINRNPIFDADLLELLNHEISQHSYSIYQLKNDPQTRDYRFEPLERLQSAGLMVDSENYDLVYTAPLTEKDTLEGIFRHFDLDIPEDYTGRSLSVSDVVVLHREGRESAYYVDSFGFQELSDFQEQQLVNQKYDPGSILQKLDLMQRETGARPFVFPGDAEASSVVSLPAEADDYLTPEEQKAAEDLIAQQALDAEEPEETEDYGMDLSM